MKSLDRRRVRVAGVLCSIATFGCASPPAGPVAQPAEPVVFVEAVPSEPARRADAGPSEKDRERAKASYAEGAERYQLGDYAGALECFEQAYTLVRLPALRFNIARCRLRLGDTLGACAELTELLADPDTDEHLRENATMELTHLGC